MKPIEIVVIIAAVAIVAGVIIASVVRKLKGKPSLASDCSCESASKACECDNQASKDGEQALQKTE